MGRQYGEQFCEELSRCVEHYTPWLYEGDEKLTLVIANIRRLVETHWPELWQETLGMSEGAHMDADIMFGYQFFTDVRMQMQESCSVIFFADSDQGPLLGRNCDLSPKFDPEIQVCQIAHPKAGLAAITVGYLGLAGGVGLNEAGLATAGASAHTDESPPRHQGLPAALLGGRLLTSCRSLAEALAFLEGKIFLGKPHNLIVCDAAGNSAIIEFASGRTPIVLRRARDCQWQACTNFFQSGQIPIAREQEYLQSAYARYGRIVHQVGNGQTSRTLDGMKRLLTEVAQPGFCDTGMGGQAKTAYSHISEVANGGMHLAPGHPEEANYEEVPL